MGQPNISNNKAVPRRIELDKTNYKFIEDDPDNFHAFIHHNNVIPSVLRVCGQFLYFEVLEIIMKHYESKREKIIQEWDLDDEFYRSACFKVVHDDGGCTYIKIKKSFKTDDTEYVISGKKKKYKDPTQGWLMTNEVEILYDIEKGKPTDLADKINKISLDENMSHNKIGLICQGNDGTLYTKDFPMFKEDFDFDLDLHYGNGFSKFHDTTVKRIDDNKKGIILFHGVPGSGKTTYIKRLIRDLMQRDKKILYVPNNIVDLLGTPSFNNFLLDYIDDVEDDNESSTTGILMIIEDAEKVLMKRDNNPYGSSGVSNILNSTDGILNDFLSIQVLATFNCSIEEIDSAILRKKRALSIKEFKKLSVEDAQSLIDSMGIKYTATEPMSLADVYSIKQEEEDKILFADSKKKQNKIGF